MNITYLLIGGNIGDREHNLSQAINKINENCGTIMRLSAVYETAAWGVENQQAFLNRAVELETHLSPTALLTCLLAIETNMGRQRKKKYGPRIIDIDIIFYADAVVDTESLKLPHPQMQWRRFVLAPLAELAPQLVHPVLHKTVQQLLEECTDMLPVTKGFKKV